MQREYKTEQETGIESETRPDKRHFGKRSDSRNAAYGKPVFEIKKSSIANSRIGGKLKTFDIGSMNLNRRSFRRSMLEMIHAQFDGGQKRQPLRSDAFGMRQNMLSFCVDSPGHGFDRPLFG